MANLRIAMFATTALSSVFLVHLDVHQRADNHTRALFFFATMLLLAYLCFAFIQFVSRTHGQGTQIEHVLLVEKQQLEMSRKALQRRERDARRLALIAEHTMDSVITTDPDGKIERQTLLAKIKMLVLPPVWMTFLANL